MAYLPVPSLATPQVGQPISQSYLKGQMYDPANFLLNKPGAMLYQNAAWSAPGNTTYSALPWNAAIGDKWGGWSVGSPSVWTVPASGIYLVSCNMAIPASSGTTWYAFIAKNGNNVTGGKSEIVGQSVTISFQCGPVKIPASAGDTISTYVTQSSAAAVSMANPSGFENQMTISFDSFQ